MPSLNKLKPIRRLVQRAQHFYLTKIWGMDIDPAASFSLSAKLDKTYPAGIHIGPETYIAFGATILTHDMAKGLYLDTYIGKRCFIRAYSVILPGVRIGNESIVVGSVVTKDAPSPLHRRRQSGACYQGEYRSRTRWLLPP